jgi:hypothetical protein
MFQFWEHQVIQDVVDTGWVDRINPVSGFEGRTSGILRFVCPGNETAVYLGKSYVYLKLRIVGTGQTLKAGSTTEYESRSVLETDFTKSGCSVVNAIAHSLFRSCEVKLGNQIITLGNSDYAYTTMFQIMCSTSKEAQETYFTVIGWVKDPAGTMENTDTVKNPALKTRRDLFTKDEAIAEFIIRPHTAITTMDKCLCPYTDFEISLTRHSNPQFYMNAINNQTTATPYDIEIVQAYYEIQRYRCTPSFSSDFELMLKKHPVVYNLKDSHIHTCTIPSGVSNYSNDSLFHGVVPRRILIAFVKTENYNGSYTTNPFNFEHFNIESLRLLKNGLEYPVKETITNFKSKPKTFMQAYHRMMMSLGVDYHDHVVSITPNEYANGYFFYSFLMSPDQEQTTDINNVTSRPAQIKIDVRFADSLATSVQMIVYSESETSVSVDMTRRVVVTHK